MKKIIILMGLSGTGKSFLAELLSEHFGFVWIRSDLIRKEIMGIDPRSKVKAYYGTGIYAPEITILVYYTMLESARECIKKGAKVVLDATFCEEWQRELALRYFPEALYINTIAPEETVKERLKNRVDVSDADYSIYLKQKAVWKDPEYAVKVNTDKNKSLLLEELENLIK